ncbi:MAG: hypothetical protein KDK61_08705, partial [Simkania sp.]|nr:hypothetical protein [Simkania sp.]
KFFKFFAPFKGTPFESLVEKKKMGTLGFEPKSAGVFLEAIRLQQINYDNHRHRISAAHRSKTGAGYSSQVIICPQGQ